MKKLSVLVLAMLLWLPGSVWAVDSKISADPTKDPPVAADLIPILDTEASNANKKITLLSIRSLFKTYFDTIYSVPLTGSPSNLGYEGPSVIGTAGENLVILDLCYLKSDGKYWKAKADAAATMPAVAMATTTINADTTGPMLLSGYIRKDDGWGGALTIGSPTGELWVSAATAGLATQTQPAVSTNIAERVGYAIGARTAFFDPNRTTVTVP